MNTPKWMQHAACRNHPASLFIPERATPKLTAQAKAICNTCPVLDQCRQYALELHAHGQLDGIFAGMTPKERRTQLRITPHQVKPKEQNHGTLYSYRQLRCRCHLCRQAHTDTIRRQRETRRNAPRHISAQTT
jgi:WhiB family redox-sensing transcriptional regulator